MSGNEEESDLAINDQKHDQFFPGKFKQAGKTQVLLMPSLVVKPTN
jgi:hypothetical protein